MRISDWGSDVCSSDLVDRPAARSERETRRYGVRVCRRGRGGFGGGPDRQGARNDGDRVGGRRGKMRMGPRPRRRRGDRLQGGTGARSEEHTSELQSLMRISYAVFCLKKKTNKK